ncbi:tyrosine-type recombinase/integrase [Mesorhizobium shangrilense]|uniref:Tyrosine-type recombinase/integrase n=1 Tax=Mesorhizobium shangrilense TaxID=460060 RepID=A0ABV2DSN1_9HYPH
MSPQIDQFAASLAAQRYTPLTIEGYTASARHFAAWLGSVGISSDSIDDDVIGRFSEHRCRCPGSRRWQRVSPDYWRRAKRFCVFLQQVGVGRAPLKVASPYPLLDDYQGWLRVHRGLSERTIARHLHHLHKLLPELGTATHDSDAALVRNVVREWRERTGPADLRTITSACVAIFASSRVLACAAPTSITPSRPSCNGAFRRCRGILVPPDVERVIESCDQLTRGRLRDRAILLLLARLGLRAGDVAGLRLSDVDLSGKARRQVRLPLPQDVGDALLAYIEQERPRVHQEAVFLGMVAPYRSFSRSSHVSTIVALALKRAGISNPPSTGASLLRHSAATSMLRSGATLEAVGTVLRHRSLDMTAHYAKVDIPMLEQIAQPWPGELTC